MIENFLIRKIVRITRDICYHADIILNRDIISSNCLESTLSRNYQFFQRVIAFSNDRASRAR